MEYDKQTWDTTSYVNPTRMNHMEDGIKGNSDAVVDINEALDDIDTLIGDTSISGIGDGKITGAIASLNSNLTKSYSLGDVIDLKGYTSTSNSYTAPKDGYVFTYSNSSSGNGVVYFYGETMYVMTPVNTSQVTFVKKGATIHCNPTAIPQVARFYPLSPTEIA